MSKTLIILIVAGMILLLAGLWFAYDRDAFWQRMAGDPDQGQTDFANLKKAPKPNEALACPAKTFADICPLRDPDIRTSAYDLTPVELSARLVDIFTADRLITRVDERYSPERLRFVRRTPLMRYPDTFSVEIIALPNNTATFAIHGRALIGYSDMGNNLKLVKQVVDQISAFKTAG